MKTEITISGLLAAWYVVKTWIDRLSKIVEPVVKEAERRALDGKIDRPDRKAIALTLLAELEANGTVKLNFISRIIINKVIDIVAKKLPDYNATLELKRLNET